MIQIKAVLGQYELFTDQNTRDHLACSIGNGDPMYGVCTHTGYLAHRNGTGEARGRNKPKGNSRSKKYETKDYGQEEERSQTRLN